VDDIEPAFDTAGKARLVGELLGSPTSPSEAEVVPRARTSTAHGRSSGRQGRINNPRETLGMTIFRPDDCCSWLRRLHHRRRLAGRVTAEE